MKQNYIYISLVALVLCHAPAYACDPCALYSASRLQGHSAGTFTLSISEQYTNYDRADDLTENSIRDGEVVRGFSTTQLAGAYDVTERFGIQLTVPIVARRFDQIEHYRSSTESDAGIGDLSLVGTYSFIDYKEQDWAVIAGVTGGVKFPTGDTGVLEDISQEEDSDMPDKTFLKHHQMASASGGRALAFGSGSYDYIVGLNLLSRYQRYLILSSVQYTIRTEGDYDYEFADDFLWSVSSGYYFMLGHESTVAGLLTLSGEIKANDHLNNELVQGSDVSNVYLGPGLLFTLDDTLGAELGLDFRVTDEDSGSTIVPETRLRASLSYRFS